jgi:DNA-binding NtrC family response regulator
VLVADGDDAIRSLLSAIVQRMQLVPVTACDGDAAVALLSQRKFDAVVLDLRLPGTSGEEIVARLGREQPELVRKTIVITTLPKASAKCAGVAAILRKPFALDEITAAIQRCCAE